MTITRTFTRQELDELDVPWEHMVEEHVTDTMHRWHNTHEGVFRHPDDGRHRIRWQVGATECQECDLWDDEDTVTAVQVEQRPVTVMQWLPVDDGTGSAT